MTADARSWIEVSLSVPTPDVEAVADILRELAGAVALEPSISADDDEDFSYKVLDEPVLLSATVPAPFDSNDRRALRRRLDALILSEKLPRLNFAEVADEDWSENWKQSFTVQRVGQRIVIAPSWEDYERQTGEIVVTLDPGRAFGTGEHQTTRLCLAAIERLIRPGDAVVDVGTGSGILATAAARLGAGSVVAVENDSDAALVAHENIERNGLAKFVTVVEGTLGPELLKEQTADLIVMNISSAIVRDSMMEVTRTLKPGGFYVASGFIDETLPAVQRAAAAAGLRMLGVDEDDEWRCIVASAPSAR
ncbi:MAG TPA: 50S ribosomal protein L11 methyltransferase [Dehalococcoidia bacterium]|nr:50S ribosomal protein L11 methyltransferase [Dehalococcoidia bacterium]